MMMNRCSFSQINLIGLFFSRTDIRMEQETEIQVKLEKDVSVNERPGIPFKA